MRFLIQGGRVVDPALGLDEVRDVLIEDGRIQAIQPNLQVADAETLDAKGLLVTPGLIDMHVHLREPGQEHKETIATGTHSAAMGGFTAVACMANTDPVIDNPTTLAYVRDRAAREGVVHVFPIGALTKGLKGEEMAAIGEMAAEGAVALSDDGRTVINAGLMRRAMTYAKFSGLPVIDHAMDDNLAADGVMNEGPSATALGLRGIPAQAEEVIIARDVLLAELTGCPIHIAHVSTAGGVRIIREAKSRGIAVTGEACPHHFTLTDQAVTGYDTNTKMNPPLRSLQDVEAIREGLRDGTLDCIVTDHAPHSQEEKDSEYDLAPFGIVGLETSVPLVFTFLVEGGILTVPQAIAKMSANPAAVLRIDKGCLQVGATADVTIIDPNLELTVDIHSFASKSHNSPFHGWRLRGWPVATLVSGKLVMRNRKLLS